jgi:IclR family transcriptional regulator, acetate operon repressor
MPGEVPAVANAVRLLERMAEAWPEPVSPGALISELGLNRSTCYNILATLQQSGWATTRGARSGWSLGPRLLTLTGIPAGAVTAIVQRELDDLSRRLGFVVFACQRTTTGRYEVLAKAERGQGVRVTVSVGDSFPFSAPAIMQAFCAWGPPGEFGRLAERYGIERFTPRTVTGSAPLQKLLRRTRQRGYGTSLQEYDQAQAGVAAPVFGAKTTVVMVLCALAFSSELDESNIAGAGEQVRDAALRITAQTGGRPPSGAGGQG